MTTPYRLLAIDLDGTLLDDHGRISDANRAAIDRARSAGIEVVPCTGRGWREAHRALEPVGGIKIGVFITGAMVADIPTGQSHDLAVIEPHLASELVAFLADQPEAVLIYREHNLTGHEYLVTGSGELTDNTRWWFQATSARVHEQRQLAPADLRHTLRVGMVASAARMKQLTHRVRQAFADRVLVHSFAAMNYDGDPDHAVHVLEIFAAGVDKWRGLKWIAHQRGLTPDQIAAIGDQINDLSMLQNAGCAIAMGNAAPQAKDRAHHITHTNARDGVAHAIDQLLTGAWG